MFTKYATAQILNFADSGKVKTAGKKQKLSGFEYEPRNDGHKYMYVAVRACTADVPNLNYDMLPDSELGGKEKYKTFEGAYVYLNHDNTDPAKARGAIIAAKYHDEGDENGDKWVEILEELDEEKCPKLCSLIRSGEIDTVSMGCSVESTTCSICGNTAEYPHEFCEHIQQKGNVYGGKLAYEICNGIDFFECSWVYDPADPTAHVQALNKEASMRKRAGRAKVAVEWYEFDQDHYMSEPVGGDCAQIEPKDGGFEAWFMTADDAALSFATELDGKVFPTAQEAMDAAGDYLTRNASVKTALNPNIPDYPEFSDEGPGGWYSKVGPDQCIVVNYDAHDRSKWWAEYMDLAHPSNGKKTGPFDSFEEAMDAGGREFCASRKIAVDLNQPFDPHKLTYKIYAEPAEFSELVGWTWEEPYYDTVYIWDDAYIDIKYDGALIAEGHMQGISDWIDPAINNTEDMDEGDIEDLVLEELTDSFYWAVAFEYPDDFFSEYAGDESIVTLGDFIHAIDSGESFSRELIFNSIVASRREGERAGATSRLTRAAFPESKFEEAVDMAESELDDRDYDADDIQQHALSVAVNVGHQLRLPPNQIERLRKAILMRKWSKCASIGFIEKMSNGRYYLACGTLDRADRYFYGSGKSQQECVDALLSTPEELGVTVDESYTPCEQILVLKDCFFGKGKKDISECTVNVLNTNRSASREKTADSYIYLNAEYDDGAKADVRLLVDAAAGTFDLFNGPYYLIEEEPFEDEDDIVDAVLDACGDEDITIYDDMIDIIRYVKTVTGSNRRAAETGEDTPMPNYADAPRKPDEISTHEDQRACPLCGSLAFDGGFCEICGYQTPPEGFDDIQLENEETYDEYEDEAQEDEQENDIESEDDVADEFKEMLSHRIGFAW